MKNKIGYIILGIIVCIFTFCVIATKNNKLNQTTIATNSKVLTNKKIEWGIKRNNNNEQPDLGANNKTLIEKYDGYAIGCANEKIVYLTFDNGYEAGYTAQILDVLKETEVKATFFITGHYLNTQPELVKRMIDEGHIVGNQFSTMVMYHI